MQAEINEAYQSALKALGLYETVSKRHVETLKKLADAEAQLDSVTAFVTKEVEESGVSKTALKEIVKGDARVIDAKKVVNNLKREKEAGIVRIEYCKAYHDLEKKRMSAEMEEAKRFNYNE